MIIGLDFDGTVVKHEFPKIGEDIGAVPFLKALIERGDKIVLNTMRSGKYLEEALSWFSEKGIQLYGINHNPDQRSWTTSPKVYAEIYIDDAALGAPLTYCDGDRPYINWGVVGETLGLYKTLKEEL